MTDFGERARRPVRRTTIDRRMPAPSATQRSRSWPIWFAGTLSLGVSFFVTLQLTRPAKPPSPAVTAMTRSVVSDRRTLIAAIRAAGLAGSPNVKGEIDEIARLDDKRVSIGGWAGEVGNGGAPLDVLVFVDGENRLAMQTAGRHVDVTGALGLSDAATARNVSFRGAVACGRGQKLIVVAIADSGSYGYFSPRPCP
jgi:hypothetical protein